MWLIQHSDKFSLLLTCSVLFIFNGIFCLNYSFVCYLSQYSGFFFQLIVVWYIAFRTLSLTFSLYFIKSIQLISPPNHLYSSGNRTLSCNYFLSVLWHCCSESSSLWYYCKKFCCPLSCYVIDNLSFLPGYSGFLISLWRVYL